MTVQRTTLIERVSSHGDALRAFAMLAALLAAMAVLTAIFGVTHPGPGYEIVPDPAIGMPF